MDEFDPISKPDNGSMDDDFEKVPPMNDEVTTTSAESHDDIFSSSGPPEPQPTTGNLLDFGESSFNPPEPSAPPPAEPEPEPEPEPVPVPDTTEREPTPPPAPKPVPPKQSSPGPATRTDPSSKEGGWKKNIDPKVLDLIYWRDIKMTGAVFGSIMFLLISLACFSLLSVLAYLSMAALTVTFSFRVYKNVLQAVQKSGEGHPFKQWLDMDISIQEDCVQKVTSKVLTHVNKMASCARALFLVEDLVDSIKFGLFLWMLTYMGAWFNGMTLLILAVVGVFTIPKVYETYQVQIDNYVGLAKEQIDNVLTQVKAKLPFLQKKPKTQ